MVSIGVRYCGGCNPRIDRGRIVRDLKAGLEERGVEVDFTTDRERPVDLLLLVNGCLHGCLEAEYRDSTQDQQVISVRGEMVDDRYIEEARIPEFLIGKILERVRKDMAASGSGGESKKGGARQG
jgi:hypothetical protein